MSQQHVSKINIVRFTDIYAQDWTMSKSSNSRIRLSVYQILITLPLLCMALCRVYVFFCTNCSAMLKFDSSVLKFLK